MVIHLVEGKRFCTICLTWTSLSQPQHFKRHLKSNTHILNKNKLLNYILYITGLKSNFFIENFKINFKIRKYYLF